MTLHTYIPSAPSFDLEDALLRSARPCLATMLDLRTLSFRTSAKYSATPPPPPSTCFSNLSNSRSSFTPTIAPAPNPKSTRSILPTPQSPQHKPLCPAISIDKRTEIKLCRMIDSWIPWLSFLCQCFRIQSSFRELSDTLAMGIRIWAEMANPKFVRKSGEQEGLT